MTVKLIPGKNSVQGGVVYKREDHSLSVWFGDLTIKATLDHDQITMLGEAMVSPAGADYAVAFTSFTVEKFVQTN